jgi:hypothetical protein
MRRLRAQLLGASLAVATATAAGARPLLLPASAAATLAQAFRSWLAPHAVRDAALESPRLAAPPGSDEFALEWTGLPHVAANYTLLASDWWSGSDAVSRTVYSGAELSAELSEHVMPDTPTTFVLVASDGNAELARSAGVTFSAAEAGACGNLADATVWRCVPWRALTRRRDFSGSRCGSDATIGSRLAMLTRLAASGTTGRTCTTTWRRAWRSAAQQGARAPRRAWKSAACCLANAAPRAGTSFMTARSTTARCRAASARRAANAGSVPSRRAHRLRPSATGFQSGHGRRSRRDWTCTPATGLH